MMSTTHGQRTSGVTPGGRSRASSAVLEAEIHDLADLPRPDLVARWRSLYRADPPQSISQRLLVAAIAYELQARRYGGLRPAIARRLRQIANGQSADHGSSKYAKVTAASKLKPGARLIREWNGSIHEVEVVEGGFIWNGKRHGSLSAVAQAITGARWSGPRFFALTSDGIP